MRYLLPWFVASLKIPTLFNRLNFIQSVSVLQLRVVHTGYVVQREVKNQGKEEAGGADYATFPCSTAGVAPLMYSDKKQLLILMSVMSSLTC